MIKYWRKISFGINDFGKYPSFILLALPTASYPAFFTFITFL
jgi:hypothetical protein